MAMATPSVTLGIDLGTTSVKAAVVEAAPGHPSGFVVLASCVRATRAEAAAPSAATAPQAREQDVSRIIQALNECLAALPQQALRKVCGIGVSGQMHGVMFWKTGQGCEWTEGGAARVFQPRAVSQLVTWQDGRCSSEFLASLPQPESHLSVATGFGCATIFWLLKNSPEFLKSYDAAGTIHDYVVAMLCGLPRPLMSDQNAASWGYFNTQSQTWNVEMSRSPVPTKFTSFRAPILSSVIKQKAPGSSGKGLSSMFCKIGSPIFTNPSDECIWYSGDDQWV